MSFDAKSSDPKGGDGRGVQSENRSRKLQPSAR
jgi:hypothetical protein